MTATFFIIKMSDHSDRLSNFSIVLEEEFKDYENSMFNNNKIEENNKLKVQCGQIYIKRDGTFSFLCTCRNIKNSLTTNQNKFTDSELKICGYISVCDKFNFICKLCLKILNNFIEFSNHIFNEHSNIYQVNTIDNFGHKIEDLSSRSSAESHQISLNDVSKELKLDKIHSISFNVENDLINHNSLHTTGKSLQCSICNKIFKKTTDLNRHKRVHTGEKPFVCDYCGKKFRTSSHLNEHRRIHTGEKKFKCKICTKVFTTSSNLSEHKRTHSNERPYSCEKCGKTFISSSHLFAHKKIHLESNIYKCNICNITFKHVFSYKRHLKIHTGEKPHICVICKKDFNSLYNLKEHERIHTGEKRYTCSVCQKSFTHCSSLSHHKKRHLNDNTTKSNTLS